MCFLFIHQLHVGENLLDSIVPTLFVSERTITIQH